MHFRVVLREPPQLLGISDGLRVGAPMQTVTSSFLTIRNRRHGRQLGADYDVVYGPVADGQPMDELFDEFEVHKDPAKPLKRLCFKVELFPNWSDQIVFLTELTTPHISLIIEGR